jgi:hypothetical protein
LGPGGTVFSAGPDGARDFIYEGAIKGFESKGWDGYLVIQAKFREKLEGAPGDITWLESQITSELKKFTDEKRGLRRPDYYILATNVPLSGADSGRGVLQKKGGHTKIAELFNKWKTEIGLRDFHIWPSDQIIDLLANHPKIRQHFAAWVTPGDVLTAILSELQPLDREFGSVIPRALKRRIAVDQFVALNEAGSVSNVKLATSKVFIDLPVQMASSPGGVASSGTGSPDQKLPGFVKSLVDVAKSRLDADSSPELTPEDANTAKFPSRIVLLGGPGQGKSTSGLFAVQILRAAVLRDDPAVKSNPTIREVVPEILSRATEEGIPGDFPHRFPIHVRLPDYADRISHARSSGLTVPSLLAQIAHDVEGAADATEGTVRRQDLRFWLGAYPWLIVLDGLDEVPPSGERVAIINAINTLVSEISDLCADVLLVVTSRPQGYNKELDEKYWSHWYLSDLPPERACAYANALSAAQHPYDSEKRGKIRKGVERAITQPATARLMVSPLQVTIMHVIIDGEGSTPAGRWELFSEYYRVLKKREKSKGGETQKILESNWEHLDPVHHRAGLVLQTESELSGTAGAHLSRPRLKKLIKGYLETIGYDDKDQEARSEELAGLALNRLVLLSMRQQGPTEDDGLISFDVRSLQEFMAAAELTTQPETKDRVSRIEERLTHISGIAHWRHTFLIAASRCFSDTALNHLRSVVVSVPRTLDATASDRAAYNGAYLALDMLADGIAINHPVCRRMLIIHAMEILDTGPTVLDNRLMNIWNEATSLIFQEELRYRLSNSDTAAALAGWKLLFLLCGTARSDTFIPIARAMWPKDQAACLKILSNIEINSTILSTFSEEILNSMKSISPFVSNIKFKFNPTQEGTKPASELGAILSDFFGGKKTFDITIHLSDGSQLETTVRPIKYEPLISLERHITGWTGGWPVFRAIGAFANSPSPEGLARCLQEICTTETLAEAKKSDRLPWLIEGLVQSATDTQQLKELIDAATREEFGDLDAWLAAEERWTKKGITKDDFMQATHDMPFGKDVATRGAPLLGLTYPSIKTSRIGNSKDELSQLLEIRRHVGNQAAASHLAKAAETTMQFNDIAYPHLLGRPFFHHFHLSAAIFAELLSILDDDDPFNLGVLNYLSDDVWENHMILSLLSQKIANAKGVVYFQRRQDLPILHLMKAYTSYPDFRPFLYAIAMCIISAGAKRAKELIMQLPPCSFGWDSADLPCTSAGVAILRILKNRCGGNEEIAALTSEAGLSIRLRLAELLSGSEHFVQEGEEELAKFLVKLREGLGARMSEVAPWLYKRLKKSLDARKSGISDRTTWIEALRLPEDAYNVLSLRI